MGKAILGAALLVGAAVVTGGAAGVLGATLEGVLAPLVTSQVMGLLAAVALQGAAMEAGVIADALTSNRGTNITTRQQAGFRQIGYGSQRIGGILVYESTTASNHRTFNQVIAVYAHTPYAIDAIHLDGRQVFFDPASYGVTTRNGVSFGGHGDGQAYTGPDGQRYSFSGEDVYCEARYGDEVSPGVMTSLRSNDPTWDTQNGRTPLGIGICWLYLKLRANPDVFPQRPEVRITVRGRDTILDPRTGLRGYSENPALIIADILCDPVYGLGCDWTEINETQLIAAANVCDEQVPLASGQFESRYTAHYHYDTSTGPGDVLKVILDTMAGRLSRVGGEWFIVPAYWQGPSFSFDKSILTGPVEWIPARSLRDRINRVTGTFTSPQYPYNVAGNYYSSPHGYGPDGTTQNVFNDGYQVQSFPQYASDVAHGYTADLWLEADGGVVLPREVSFPAVLSIAQAQRLAKIMLMRNRFEGTGTLRMHIGAWGLMPTSVMQFTMPEFLGWTDKVLEVSACRMGIEDVGGAPAITFEVDVNEVDPSIYEWSTAEEQTAFAVQALPAQVPYSVTAPTGLVLSTVTSTGQNAGLGGNSTNSAIGVAWVPPADTTVVYLQVQFKPHSSATWIDAGSASVSSTMTLIYGVTAGQVYDVRIRSTRASGAASAWVEQDNYTV